MRLPWGWQDVKESRAPSLPKLSPSRTQPDPHPTSRREGNLTGILLVLLLCVAGFWLSANLATAVYLGVAALGLAAVLSPFVIFLEQKEVDRYTATLLTSALCAVLLLLVLNFLSPLLGNEARYASALGTSGQMPKAFDRLKIHAGGSVTALISIVAEASLLAALTLAAGFENILMPAFVVIVMASAFLLDKGRIEKAVISAIPNRNLELIVWAWHRTWEQCSRFVRAQSAIALLAALTYVAAFALLQLPLACSLGIMAGAASIIPYFGPIIGAAPAIALSAVTSTSWATPVTIVIAFATFQLFRGPFSSRLPSAKVQLPPFIAAFSMTIGATLQGYWGMVLAVPLAFVAWIFIKQMLAGIRSFGLRP